MSAVLNAIARHARARPKAPALKGAAGVLEYGALHYAIASMSLSLIAKGVSVLGVLLDNGPEWALVDLAAQRAGITLIPLPGFFSPTQLVHAIDNAGIEAVVVADAAPWQETLTPPGAPVEVLECPPGPALSLLFTGRRPNPRLAAASIAKVTYTSGTTGTPKGVCLSAEAMDKVATSLAAATAMDAGDRHLAALPLATLLENIGGVYAPLLAGASAVLQPLPALGVRGANGLDAAALHRALCAHKASTTILMPQMLQGLVETLESGAERSTRLRFAAVGGAPLAPSLLDRAHGLGLPVYEGYGLSECASVVALNTPAAGRPGSVGRVLDHAQLRFAADGEVLVRGATHAGYLDAPALEAGDWVASGDLGHLDGDGFLWITGRKKNLFITAYGRNVAPEWIERELVMQGAIAQAAVFGEGRPWNAAVIVPAPEASAHAVDAALAAANNTLPDYARVHAWVRAAEPFSVANGELTGTGRLRRQAIWNAYASAVEALYNHELKESTA